MYENFFVSTKEQQIKFIVDMMGKGESQENINYLIDFYEHEYDCSFSTEKLKYDYGFLAHIDINQAINLYDSLLNEKKSEIISVIESSYTHLSVLIDIHHILNDVCAYENIIFS